MTSVASVKDKLKNRALSSGKSFQEMLIAYGLERTIYKLSISEYAERFTLKGGIFLYALFEGEKTLEKVDLKDVVELLQTLLKPIVDSITSDKEFTAYWNHEIKRWI